VTAPERDQFIPYQYAVPPIAELGALLWRMSDEELLCVARDPASEPHRRAADAALRAGEALRTFPRSLTDEELIPAMAAKFCFERNLIDLQEFRERAPMMLTEAARALPGELHIADLLADYGSADE